MRPMFMTEPPPFSELMQRLADVEQGLIAERFNASYPHYDPHYGGLFARVITFKTEYAQSQIDDFSGRDKAPRTV